jgi:signal transduction histidine kinase
MNAMLDRLQVAGEKQRRFVADASHELQTPLAAVRTELEVALAHPDARPWPDVALDLLDENGHMERLVADLLFVARADDGAPSPGPAPRPIDLHEVVLDEVARLAATVGHRLAVDAGGVDGAFVLGRREDLARAVRNLLDNAAHHARSTITIALVASNGDGPGRVMLVVDDDGSGVPPEDRLRIFERFTRLDDARSRHTGGTGLGLAIVSEIAESHDGHVHVEAAPTGGARFLLTLPADN